MPLPDRPRATREVGGITVHSLTYAEVRHMKMQWGPAVADGSAGEDAVAEAEAFMLACGTDETPEAAAAWIAANDAMVVDELLKGIRDVSRLPTGEKGAPDPQASSSGS